MMRRFSHRLPLLAMTILTLSACGGENGGLSSTPTPTPTPTPMAAPLVAPQLAPSPAPVLATGPAASFSTVSGSTIQFPLAATVVGANYGGDQAAVDAGETLELASNGSLAMSANGVQIQSSVRADNLDYTRYGIWSKFTTTVDAGGAFVGGFQTPVAGLPTVGTATYSGRAALLTDEAAGTGSLAVMVNFGNASVNGTMTNWALVDGSNLNLTFNDIAFVASIQPGQNLFTGTTSVTSNPNSFYALTGNPTGAVTGLFFGPSAQEIGGAWTLSNGPGRAIGSFAGKQ